MDLLNSDFKVVVFYTLGRCAFLIPPDLGFRIGNFIGVDYRVLDVCYSAF